MASSTRRSAPGLARARQEEARLGKELDKQATAMARIKAALKSGRQDLAKLKTDLDNADSTGKKRGRSEGKAAKARPAKADGRTAKATSAKSNSKSGSKKGDKKGSKKSR